MMGQDRDHLGEILTLSLLSFIWRDCRVDPPPLFTLGRQVLILGRHPSPPPTPTINVCVASGRKRSVCSF